MTDPMTTTRDGDVLTEANLQAIRHWAIRGKYIRHSDVFLLLDYIASLQQRLDAAEQRSERLEAFLLELNRERYSLPRTISEVARQPENERSFSLDYWRGQMAILEWAIDDTAPLYGFTLTEQERDHD